MTRDLTPAGRRFLRNLQRRKFYGPNHHTATRWRVEMSVRTDIGLTLLGHWHSEWAVFRFRFPHIGPRVYPEDKFAGTRIDAERLFYDMIKREHARVGLGGPNRAEVG